MTRVDTPTLASTPEQVVGEARLRRNRKRTARATLLRRINAESRERQTAWLATDRPNVTAQLTSRLEESYQALREDRATDRVPRSWDELHDDTEHVGVEWLPFYGRPPGVADV